VKPALCNILPSETQFHAVFVFVRQPFRLQIHCSSLSPNKRLPMSDVDVSNKRLHSSLSSEESVVTEAIYVAWYEACEKLGELEARRKFARVLHEPLPAHTQPKKSILKKQTIGVVDPKPSPSSTDTDIESTDGMSADVDAMVEEAALTRSQLIGLAPMPEYTMADAQQLIDKQVCLHRWKQVEAWGFRDAPTGDTAKPPTLHWYEFIEETPKHKNWDYKQELQFAGYGHWAGCTQNGWRGSWRSADNKHSIGRSGWGREITDIGRLEVLNEMRLFFTPTPHYSGDGWCFSGKHYRKAEFPDADEWGPRGANGPRYGSNFTGD
jgi:hypothetical protein